MPLTDTHIRSLKPESKPRKYFDGGGLFLFIPANGSKLWRRAYRFDGKSKLLSFGEYPTISLTAGQSHCGTRQLPEYRQRMA